MANPFEKRATEYLADTEAFLAVVTPEPLVTFFKKPAKEGHLYDRLVTVTGTPGSGKTTLARLFEFSTVRSILQNSGLQSYRPLIDALTQCGVLDDLKPAILGARVPMESEYRDFWEFPYPEDVRTSLTTALIQSRAVIRWLRQLADAGVSLTDIAIIPRDGAEAALEQIGGTNGHDVLERARAIERGIYGVARALVPPPLATFDASMGSAYHPFDVIERIRFGFAGGIVEVAPLAIFDDAHSLHPAQYEFLQRWLSQREIRVARWVLTRLDALSAASVLTEVSVPAPGVQRSRVMTEIRMQSGDRKTNRGAFRKMARDMSSRYLGQMNAFSRRGLRDLGDLLLNETPAIPSGKLDRLRRHVDVVQSRVGASDARREEFEADIEAYFNVSTANQSSPELHLATLAILLERLGRRTPQLSLGILDDEVEPARPISVSSGVIEGARIHLLHGYDVPYYVGLDALCDASSENAEQFLQLASRLVSQSETQLIRGKNPGVTALEQHKLLRKRSTELINQWDFPYHRAVKQLAALIAEQCLARSLEGNASLGGGANSWGILQEEFDQLPRTHPNLARILHFGVAYNAFVLVPNHGTKRQKWCLIELSGVLLVHHGLTLRRGGFLERGTLDLATALAEPADA